MSGCGSALLRRAVPALRPVTGTGRRSTAGLPENVEARAFAVHPREPDVIYAGTQDGPYRTTDGGARWERLGFPDRGAVVWSLAFHPTRPKVMYAGVAPVAHLPQRGRRRHLGRSSPGAKSPGHCEMGFPTRVDAHRRSIRRAPDAIYAGAGGERRHPQHRRRRNLDRPVRAAHQARRAAAPQEPHRQRSRLRGHARLPRPRRQRGGARARRFSPCAWGVFRTDDRGATLAATSRSAASRRSPTAATSSSRRTTRASCTRACRCPRAATTARSTAATTWGATWRRFDHGVKSRATMMAVAAHPRDPARVYCVSRCGQVFGTEDAGASWREYPLPEGVQDVYAVAAA